MLDLLQYGFVVRGLEAGLIIGLISPLIGIFLVLRHYSLVADTLAHVSLAGVAIGLLLKIDPIITAVGSTVLSSIIIEKLRDAKIVYGESALAIFLSGSLAVAIVLIGLAHGFSVDLFNYLFGSIIAVKSSDVLIILLLGLLVMMAIIAFYKELLYISFDEEAARVSGIKTKLINLILITLAALTVSLSIPIVGVLLISALIVVPVASALQLRTSFIKTIISAEVISVLSVIFGIVISFYANLPTGGTIVLLNLLIFIITLFARRARI